MVLNVLLIFMQCKLIKCISMRKIVGLFMPA